MADEDELGLLLNEEEDLEATDDEDAARLAQAASPEKGGASDEAAAPPEPSPPPEKGGEDDAPAANEVEEVIGREKELSEQRGDAAPPPADTDAPLEEKLRKLPAPKVGEKEKPVEFVKVVGKIALYGVREFDCADGESPKLETFSAFGMVDASALDVSKTLKVFGPLEPIGMPMGKKGHTKLAHFVFLFLYTNVAGTVVVVLYNIAKQLCEECMLNKMTGVVKEDKLDASVRQSAAKATRSKLEVLQQGVARPARKREAPRDVPPRDAPQKGRAKDDARDDPPPPSKPAKPAPKRSKSNADGATAPRSKDSRKRSQPAADDDGDGDENKEEKLPAGMVRRRYPSITQIKKGPHKAITFLRRALDVLKVSSAGSLRDLQDRLAQHLKLEKQVRLLVASRARGRGARPPPSVLVPSDAIAQMPHTDCERARTPPENHGDDEDGKAARQRRA